MLVCTPTCDVLDAALLEEVVDLLAVGADRVPGRDLDRRDLPRPGPFF